MRPLKRCSIVVAALIFLSGCGKNTDESNRYQLVRVGETRAFLHLDTQTGETAFIQPYVEGFKIYSVLTVEDIHRFQPPLTAVREAEELRPSLSDLFLEEVDQLVKDAENQSGN